MAGRLIISPLHIVIRQSKKTVGSVCSLSNKRRRSTMAKNTWQPPKSLLDALNPSTSKDHVLPRLDRQAFSDRKAILDNFINLERFQTILDSYFDDVQSEITPPMRTVLLEWMLEVCEEERCSCEVFPLAVWYVDRFLSVEVVHKRQLQALGTACLFIASKVKLITPFNATRLVDYTDEAVTCSEILSWELLVLNRLNWDVSALTPLDFVDQYLHRLKLSNRSIAQLRPSLNYLVALSVIDFPTAALAPSLIAAACLQVAATHVSGELEAGREIISTLKEIIDLEPDLVEEHANHIHELFVQRQNDPDKAPLTDPNENLCSDSKYMIDTTIGHQGSSDGVNKSTLTPTDIEDVAIF